MKTKLLIFQLFLLADQYYYYIAKGRIMLLVSGKEALKQMLNFQVHQITDESVNICWIEEPFPKDIEEILISENEVNDEEGKSDNEGDTF